MKRSSPPIRRRGLARGKGIERGGRIRSRRQPADPAVDLVRRAVFDRDRHCRLANSLFGPCHGKRLTPHHLWKDGQGGPYVMRNLLTLCAGHNDGVEVMDRADAEAAGLVVPWGCTVTEAWRRLILARIVTYWWDGSPHYRPSPNCVRPSLAGDNRFAAALDIGDGPDWR